MATLEQWVAGARPRTLPAAIVPVAVASAAAQAHLSFSGPRAFLALVVSLALQIGTNFANDYSDGRRGTDNNRVGPVRLTAARLAPPRAVLMVGLSFFLIAAIAGFILAAITNWMLLLGGGLALLAGWFYTGGSKPYGYYGFGEIFVFLFFGLFAVIGTYYVQVHSVGPIAYLIALPVGCLAVALLVINNLRDIASDDLAGKRTLAVRIGDQKSRWLYQFLIVLAVLSLFPIAFIRPFALVGFISIVLAFRPVQSVRSGSVGADLVKVLGETGRLQMVFGLTLSIGLLL